MCITVKWTCYNGRDHFFPITSGRINKWKGVNQLKELFFLNSIIFFKIYIWNWQIIGFLGLKKHYFSQFITKMGFCCKILSLNDLTPNPISRPGTHCLQWQRSNARANLWWRHEPFPGETSIALRPCAGKTGVTKRYWWCLGIIPSNGCWQFSMISRILEKKLPLTERRTSSTNHLFTLHTAAHADHRIVIPIKYRAQFLVGVGWGACRTVCMLH